MKPLSVQIQVFRSRNAAPNVVERILACKQKKPIGYNEFSTNKYRQQKGYLKT
jgi:hypothetical protein